MSNIPAQAVNTEIAILGTGALLHTPNIIAPRNLIALIDSLSGEEICNAPPPFLIGRDRVSPREVRLW